MYITSSNACINNNTLGGSGTSLAYGVYAPGSGTVGSGNNQNGLGTDLVAGTCGTAADTTPPTTSITSPAQGATVSGMSVSVQASASDVDSAVSKVEFYVDGSLKVTDTSSPYTYSWDTTAYVNGTHTLQTKAYDPSGNVGTSAQVSVTVSNAGLPVISSFSTSPTTISSGQSATLSWTTTGATSASITNIGSVSTSGFQSVSPTTTTTYTLTATNSAGSVTQSLTVTVSTTTGTVRNVQTYGATGNGSTDDTGAINSAINALVAGDELFFPCASAYYRVTSQLATIGKNNVIVDGQTGCSNGRVTITLSGNAGTIMWIGNSAASTSNYILINAVANELSNT